MKKIFIGIIVGILALLGVNTANNINLGSSGGVTSTVATSTFQAVTAGTAKRLFATSTLCSARIITTQAGAIKLTFSDFLGQRPTGINGHIQTASTTVAYDSKIYGCNTVWVYPYGTDTLTITETR